MRKALCSAVLAAGALAAAHDLYAQRPSDWMTVGNDGQRSAWVRSDPKISVDALQKPGFQLLWQIKLPNEARQLSSLTAPALYDFYIGYRGFRSLAFVGGSSGGVVGLDVDLGRIEWQKSLGSNAFDAASIACPGGLTSNVARPTFPGYPSGGGRGSGRGNPAKSGVGEPFEGAVTVKERLSRTPALPPPQPADTARRLGRVAPPANPFGGRGPQYVHALTADGKFHSLYVSNGEEPNPPVQFLPPNANAAGLIVFDGSAYVATLDGCAGVDSGVWALDLASSKVTHWKARGGVAGSAGFAVGPEGILYVATRDGELVALEPGTLAVRNVYKAGKGFTSSPVVFDYKDRDVVALTTSDGRMHLLDGAALGPQPLATTPVFSTADYDSGSLASWQDSTGKRWVLAPAGGAVVAGAGFAGSNGEVKSGAVVAFEVVEENGAFTFRPGWVSRDMVSPLPPAIVNGVVFALSSGAFRSDDARLTAAERARQSSPAVLFALDAATGRELWNSGKTIASFVHSGGLAAGGGRVYVGGHDGTQHAFGFPMEH